MTGLVSCAVVNSSSSDRLTFAEERVYDKPFVRLRCNVSFKKVQDRGELPAEDIAPLGECESRKMKFANRPLGTELSLRRPARR